MPESPEVSILAGFVLPQRRRRVWLCIPYDQRKENKHILLPCCPCSCPSALSSGMNLRNTSTQRDTGIQTPATHNQSCQNQPPTQYHLRRWLSRGQAVGLISKTPPCMHLHPHRFRLPAALPACLEHIYIPFGISACLCSSTPSSWLSYLLSLIVFTIPAPCIHSHHPTCIHHPASLLTLSLPHSQPGSNLIWIPSIQLIHSSFPQPTCLQLSKNALTIYGIDCFD